MNTQVIAQKTVWWVLWAFALSTSWLLPSFSAVWPSFDLELAAAIGIALLLGGLLFSGDGPWWIPAGVMVIGFLALIPLAQHQFGIVYFLGDAAISSLYIVGFAISIVVGRHANRDPAFAAALFFSFAFAAVLSVGIELKQWLGVQGLWGWTRDLPVGDRPIANLGQPNNLATLIGWGLMAIWWFYRQGRVGGAVAWFCAAYLLFGMTLTQSRAGWCMVLALPGLCFAYRTELGVRRYWPGLATLVVVWAIFLTSIDFLARALDVGAVETLQTRLVPGYRWAHWTGLLWALLREPWLGWGWNQVSVAQQALAPSLPAVPELLGYSHDILLDLLIWNGIPVGGLVSIGIIYWMVTTAKVILARSVQYYLCIVFFSIHCLFEYPHAYAYFLLPVGLLVGALATSRPITFGFAIPSYVAAIAGLLCLAMVAVVSLDYFRARDSFTALRYEMARVGKVRSTAPPELIVLTQLSALAWVDRLHIGPSMTDGEAERFRRTAARFPAERVLLQYAAVAAGRSEAAEATLALSKVCKLYPEDRCAFAEAVWTAWGKGRFPWVKSVPFPH